MITAMAAARAYASVAAQATNATPKTGAPAETESASGDFSQMVSKAVNDVVSTSRHAEGQMMAQAQGKADLVDVVTAISSAQSSLETVMAVRDQVISAYKEIMAMPI
jgi:flagellar hook-basal body complex protein FliE